MSCVIVWLLTSHISFLGLGVCMLDVYYTERDYATADEAVFSPCRGEPYRAVMSRASPRLVCCQATAINTWMTQEWGRIT
jgi:hypothetical protein